MHARDPLVPSLAFALVVAVLVAASAAMVSAGPTGDPPASTVAPQPDGCEFRDGSGHLNYLDGEYDYAAGLANDTAGDWTGGELLPIGANGDCSLAVTNGSATLTATTLDGHRGALRATIDLGEDGAARIVARNETGVPAASVTVTNIDRENDAFVAVVVRPAGTSNTTRTQLTAPSGRFFDLTVRFESNGTVRVGVQEATTRPPPDEWDVTAATGTTNATWNVELRSRAYLDEIAVGAWTPPTPTPTESDLFDGPTPPADPDDDDGPVSSRESSAPGGLVLGPVVLIGGVAIYRYAHAITRFQEQLDAIGSKTPKHEIEPADWNVALMKVFGGLVAVGGLWWLLTALRAVFG
jgi:hypothetical protein